MAACTLSVAQADRSRSVWEAKTDARVAERPAKIGRSPGGVLSAGRVVGAAHADRARDPAGPTADQIVVKVLTNAQGGSIVLMHLGGDETFDALPRIVEGLRAAGSTLVSLDEMLGA